MPLIDHTNFSTTLKQSTTARGSSPNGNVFFDTAANKIQLIGVDELATVDFGGGPVANPLTNFDGITMRALYNFENARRRLDETLRKFKRGIKGSFRFAGAFNFVNGVKLDATDRNKVRSSGFIEYAAAGDGETAIDRIYHGVTSLVDIQAATVPYWALVANTLEATLQAATWTNFVRAGDINEAVQVFGSTSNGDAGAGTFNFTTRILVARVRSWGYNPGETTSIATGISEFSGFNAGYGVGESINPSNSYILANVIGGAQIAPFTGMTLERLASPQVETGFNEANGNFRWVLNNTLGGTVQQCAAYLDALSLQDADVDAGAGTYNGRKGRVWYSRNAAGKVVTASIGGEGLFIEGLSNPEKQNVIMIDDAGATKTYPFFPTVEITPGAAAIADTDAWFHVYYADGSVGNDFDTSLAVTVNDALGNPVKGNVSAIVSGGKISFAYAYDTNTQAGLAAGIDKAVVVEVEGDGGAAQAITFATITRSAIVPITCAPPADNNA
jgi:hypothetical protein